MLFKISGKDLKQKKQKSDENIETNTCSIESVFRIILRYSIQKTLKKRGLGKSCWGGSEALILLNS